MNRRLFAFLITLITSILLLVLNATVQGRQISASPSSLLLLAEPSPTALPPGDGNSTTDTNIVAAPAACTGSSCTVLSTLTWQQTPLTLEQGATFTILYTSGTWTVDSRVTGFPYVGPNGYSSDIDNQITPGCKVDSSLPFARLLGQIGIGSAFSVGEGGIFTANASGVLALRINDSDTCLGDNDGAIVVQVQTGFSCAAVTEIPTSECDALVALYNSTSGTNWANSTGWLATNSPCSWYGVTCSNNRVTGLNLSGNQLIGTIPSTLDSLGGLLNLTLGLNELNGTIPAELGGLSTLQYLDFSYNQLSGSLPSTLGNLGNLASILLYNNQFSGNLPSELGNLVNLQGLHLQHNQFSGALPASLTNLTNLVHFWFNDTNLCEPGDVAFQAWLASIPNLNSTNICTINATVQFGVATYTVNENGQAGGQEVTLSTASSQPVTVQFTTSNGSATAGSDYTARNVTLNFNPGQTSQSFTVPILEDTIDENDETINLTLSNPTNATLGTLANATLTIVDNDTNRPPVANNQNVTTAQNNAVNITLTASDADNDSLTYTIVSNVIHGALSGATPNLTYTPSASFSGTDSFTFKANDGKADSNIATVNITITSPNPCYTLATSVSPVNGGTIATVPIPNCQGNKYTQGTMVSLPATPNAGYVFSQWSGAASSNANPLIVTMDGNKSITANFSQAAFSCNNVTEIPRIECEALVALYNNTTGANWTNRSGWLATTTPCSWFGVVCSNNHVTELILDGNRLVGTVPTQLSNLANLQILDLSINDLSGNIPVQLSSFTQLTKLVLGENEFSGNIPSALANLTNLIELHLDDNELTGSIPPELGRLTKLNQLWLSSNQLSGAIPPALGTLTNLTHVSLSHNQFSGAIPTEFTNLINLTTLFLQNNQFSGALPGTMPNLTKLGTFWFSDTNLCEPADTAFQSWLTRITSLRRTSVLCTPPPVDAAELVAQGDYTTVAPGELVSIWINVRNSGNTTWRASDGYGWRGTGEWSARSGAIWRDVPPGDVVSFTEDITAPSKPGEYSYGFIFQHSGQDFGLHFFIKVTVKPLPVVLVHGWNDTADSWGDYVNKFLPSIGLTGYAVNSMYTGSGGGTPLSINENAQRLAGYIAIVKQKTGAKRVDIVAHSMGGLITRRYIAKYMATATPDVRQLIMLGTPNAGSKTADALELGGTLLDLAKSLGIPRFFPPAKELTTDFVEQFNRANPVPPDVKFYAIAGNYSCSPLTKFPSSNPIEPDPDDVVVWRESVFAIAEHGRWTYPSQQSAGCEGDHRGMRSSAAHDGGQVIFSLFVSPLLRGQMPATSPELQTFAGQQTASSQADQLQVVGNALDAIQFTKVQTSTLQPGGRLEFSRIPEAGANASFIVVGQPDQMTVSLRDPNGQVITSSTTDPNIQYMQMEAEFMPITSYTISNPVPGIWTTIIEASTQTPAAGVGVAALGSLVSDLRLTLPIVEGIPVIHQPISVVAQLQNGDTPLLGSRVSAQLVFPDDTATFITLLDDGLHGDSNAGDGIYGYQFTPRNPGVYSAIISAEGMNGNITFQRSAIWATQVDGNQAFLPMVFHK